MLPANLLHSELAPRLAQYASLPSSALQYSKVGRTKYFSALDYRFVIVFDSKKACNLENFEQALVRGEAEREELRLLNRMESNRLMERWLLFLFILNLFYFYQVALGRSLPTSTKLSLTEEKVIPLLRPHLTKGSYHTINEESFSFVCFHLTLGWVGGAVMCNYELPLPAPSCPPSPNPPLFQK